MRTIVGSSAGGNNYPSLSGYVPKIYDVAGDYTYAVPANCSKLYVLVFGGGGSGAHQGSNIIGTGGGGGGFAAGYVTVTAGANISITVGEGGVYPSASGTNGNAGSNTLFGTYMSAGGGSGGNFNNSWSDTEGGAGGAGSILDTTNVSSYVTANGGRGGNWIHDTNLGSYCLTGGGNSGSLLGDGGNGGDCISGNGSDYMVSGGGGWGMGHAPTLVKWNGGAMSGGGGAPLNPGGTQAQYSTSGFRGRGMGMLWKGAGSLGTTVDPTTSFSSSRTDPSSAGTSWWSVLTGANFGGTSPMNGDGVPIGMGGTGGITSQVMGGMCAGNGGHNSTSFLHWGGYWVAGGGGNNFGSSVGNIAQNGSTLAKKHMSCGNAAGSGGNYTAYGLNGGPGLVFVFPIIT